MSFDGEVVAVTGSGDGIGRQEALELSRQGARLILCELNGESAEAVRDEIVASGGEAEIQVGDCSDIEVADGIIAAALKRFGRFDALVNNAGILRDRTFVKMTPAEWDDVVRVHLRGHYAPTNAACRYWRDEERPGRIVCTTSTAGLLGNFGQSNYGAAKAGIVAMSAIVAQEMARYNVTCNTISPAARTGMTAGAYGDIPTGSTEGFDFWSPENIAPMVAFLCSDGAGSISGKVFGVQGDVVELYEPFTSVAFVRNGGHRWTADELAERVPELFDSAGLTPEVENMMGRLRFSMTDRSSRGLGGSS
jgi:NAD(P)-dependent dehydrogenase (short-subunit alcohol dehydrogenase family)